jgi:hypothetical protein
VISVPRILQRYILTFMGKVQTRSLLFSKTKYYKQIKILV